LRASPRIAAAFNPAADHHWFKVFDYLTQVVIFAVLAILCSAVTRGTLRSLSDTSTCWRTSAIMSSPMTRRSASAERAPYRSISQSAELASFCARKKSE
jgi:hypothetical protein